MIVAIIISILVLIIIGLVTYTLKDKTSNIYSIIANNIDQQRNKPCNTCKRMTSF